MEGEGTISSSLCVLKTVLNIVSLYLEKLKKDLTLLSFWMESTQKPQLVGIGVGQSYYEEGSQNQGREAWCIRICQKEADITEAWQTPTYFQPLICIHVRKQVCPRRHTVCAGRGRICVSPLHPSLTMCVVKKWHSPRAGGTQRGQRGRSVVWSWESQQSKTQCAHMPNGEDKILPHGAA